MNLDAQREKAKLDLEALQGLVRHPGWQLLSDRIKAQAAQQLAAMRNAPTQDALLKHTYTYIALADLPDAPEVLIKTLAQSLQLTKK